MNSQIKLFVGLTLIALTFAASPLTAQAEVSKAEVASFVAGCQSIALEYYRGDADKRADDAQAFYEAIHSNSPQRKQFALLTLSCMLEIAKSESVNIEVRTGAYQLVQHVMWLNGQTTGGYGSPGR